MEAISINEGRDTDVEVINQLHAKLEHLRSMTIMLCGEGYQNFEQYNDEIKENYLWACSNMAKEARDLSRKL